MEDLLLVVASPPYLDMELYQLWLDGNSLEDALQIIIKNSDQQHQQQQQLEFRRPMEHLPFDHIDLTRYHIKDHFTTFDILSKYLINPLLLKYQTFLLLPSTDSIIEKYWELDEDFTRELLNKRLTNRSKRDLEDISLNINLPLRRIMRQFENLKAVYNSYEETSNNVDANHNIYSFVKQNYLLSSRLSCKYACILFLMISKFNLTTKKRLQRVTCEQLEFSAALILAFLVLDSFSFYNHLPSEDVSTPVEEMLLQNSGLCWAMVWKIFPAVETLDPDKQLMSSLRDIRSILTGDVLDTGCRVAFDQIDPQIISKMNSASITSSTSSTGQKMRSIVKSLLSIGANLSQSREYRDLFEDILTKVAEPLEEHGLNAVEVSHVIGCAYFIVEVDLPDISSRSFSVTSIRSDSAATPLTGSGQKMSARGVEAVKRDWLRFVLFVKLIVIQLMGGISSDLTLK